jgi:hypothetical protein
MRENEGEHRVDDGLDSRAEDGETRAQQAPVIRVLANPRRIRRP